MKKTTKILSLAAACAIAAGSLSGCGSKDENKSSEVLTYWSVMDGASSQTLSSYSEMLMYQEIEKATGVKVEFIHPVAGSGGSEAFTTLLASNDLPDMIETRWSGYAGGADAAIDDGVIISLNDYLEKWAPNYYDYVEGEKNEENNGLYRAQTITQNGNYYGFNALSIGTTRGFSGIIMRADLLKDWGMDVPVTIADWEKVFEKAKSEGYSKPFSCIKNIMNPAATCHIFNTAFDVGRGYYVEDGKVVFGPLQPGYKEFTALMADWVKKGYVDKNFVTNSSTEVEANMTNGTSVATFGWVGSMMGKLIPAMAERDPGYDLVGCPYPVMNEGDKCRWQEVAPEATDPAIAITSACEDIESAMKWCDYIYSEEGNLLHTFGVEGDTYTVEEIDGEKHYIYTEKITKPETVGASSVNAALYKFFRPANGPGLNQHPDYLNGYYEYDSQKEAIITWNLNSEAAKQTLLPTLGYTDEESSRKSILSQQYLANFETDICEIILGNKSMDEYDSVIEVAKKNMLDEILKIENKAYSRYLKNIK